MSAVSKLDAFLIIGMAAGFYLGGCIGYLAALRSNPDREAPCDE